MNEQSSRRCVHRGNWEYRRRVPGGQIIKRLLALSLTLRMSVLRKEMT